MFLNKWVFSDLKHQYCLSHLHSFQVITNPEQKSAQQHSLALDGRMAAISFNTILAVSQQPTGIWFLRDSPFCEATFVF
jgi:hypothetical protein